MPKTLQDDEVSQIVDALGAAMSALRFQAQLAEHVGGFLALNDGTHEGQVAPSNSEAFNKAGAARDLLR